MRNLSDKICVGTGGGGILCSVMSKALAQQGASVTVLDLNEEAAQKVVDEITSSGAKAVAVGADVLSRQSLQRAAEKIHAECGPVDVLINGAGGNKPDATAGPQQSFFDVPADAIQWVFNLNCLGTILPSRLPTREVNPCSSISLRW